MVSPTHCILEAVYLPVAIARIQQPFQLCNPQVELLSFHDPRLSLRTKGIVEEIDGGSLLPYETVQVDHVVRLRVSDSLLCR